MQQAGRCYAENDEEPEPSDRIDVAEGSGAVANYLLTEDRCTWIAVNGHTAAGVEDDGRPLPYPEYRAPIRAPAGPTLWLAATSRVVLLS